MSKESELFRLEKHIERLIDGYTALKAENLRLQEELELQKEETRRLGLKLDSLDSERGDVYSRVKSIIDRIERWEAGQAVDDGTEAEPEPPDEEPYEPLGVPDENTDAAERGTSTDEDRSGGVQGHLFTG